MGNKIKLLQINVQFVTFSCLDIAFKVGLEKTKLTPDPGNLCACVEL